jgi:ubiquitin-activating enzyme E1
MPTEISFKALADSLENPLKSAQDCLINADLRLFGRAEQLHIGLEAIFAFTEKNNNNLPRLNNADDANAVIALAKAINEEAKAVILFE